MAVPIIDSTALVSATDRETCLVAGIDYGMPKPVQMTMPIAVRGTFPLHSADTVAADDQAR